uniref:Inositol polyphosphate-1-phosphatase n=1 Tax=Mus musculus TaxID=10090 RepID=H3BK26_MOUSE
MSDILLELLCVSEKAANIARACRQQETLFQLLIEEKKGAEKNKKFAADFKTLADVLVQEVIKQNMENKGKRSQWSCSPRRRRRQSFSARSLTATCRHRKRWLRWFMRTWT